MSFALDALILVTGGLHVLLAPFTKVEESFNLHATHDVLMYGVGPENFQKYDHFTFPGAVPRTFIGSILLAWISTPVIQVASYFNLVHSKFDIQIIVRLVLAMINGIGLCLIRHAVSKRFGRLTGMFFALFTVSQFHVPFWMGRTLPNMFALFPVNLATFFLVDRAPNALAPSPKRVYVAIALLVVTSVIFRAEVALLLGPIVLQYLYYRVCTLPGVIKVGLLSGLCSIGLTIAADTYFWKTEPLWPEFSGIYFNVIQGKSSEWGTSPPWTYFLSYLPKLLLTALPLSLFAFFLERRIQTFLTPYITFITLISALGHKEWRFIVYVVPAFNIAASRAARWMVSRRKSHIMGRLYFLGVVAAIVLNLAATALTTAASTANYPGGVALTKFNHYVNSQPLQKSTQTLAVAYHVHISNLAAQTGASLFLQTNTPPYPHGLTYRGVPVIDINDPETWTTYNKTEGLSISALSSSKTFTHLISEYSPDQFTFKNRRKWQVIDVIDGFAGWKVNLNGKVLDNIMGDVMHEGIWGVLRMEKEEQLWILERQI
ncbi:glycosyltransferase family 22 protein [Moniliophthora roreri]|uniref:Mannosyltransferase n=1 Tax=Moniliophthora roreri TaxID=221103 RepID=A0A0W0EU70_MONRR|nr:glycosyltransferase family 22 protein [Moniliophthora roreri]